MLHKCVLTENLTASTITHISTAFQYQTSPLLSHVTKSGWSATLLLFLSIGSREPVNRLLDVKHSVSFTHTILSGIHLESNSSEPSKKPQSLKSQVSWKIQETTESQGASSLLENPRMSHWWNFQTWLWEPFFCFVNVFFFNIDAV